MNRTTIPLVLSILACKPDPTETGTVDWGPRGDCNPVDDSHCLLPFPSSFYLAQDSTTATGYRVDFGPESLPLNVDDVRTDPTSWNEKDGFPILGSLYFLLPGQTVQGVISNQDIGAYTATDARTVILDAQTGERVPHFVEIDTSLDDPERQVMMIRPVRPMKNGTRYVVGVRGIVDAAGGVLPAPGGFAALRDGTEGENDIERQRAHYEADIFPVLEEAGFARTELQLAWDLVTVSKSATVDRMRTLRDDGLSRVPAGGPTYTAQISEENDCTVEDPPSIGRTIDGTFTAPVYLTPDWEPGSVLTRDENGLPTYNGEAQIPFTIRVPCSLLLDPRPGKLVQYGHGLLGDRSEVRTGYLSDMADRYGWVLFATDWTGMKSDDVPTILSIIGNGVSDFGILPERIQQGYLEFMLAARMMKGDMASDPMLAQDGVSLVDPSQILYYGNSQGAILGGGYVAASPDIERAVFGVGGTPYSLLLTRSADFDLYLGLLQTKYEDNVDISLLIALMQMLWDPGESAGWAPFMNQEPLDDTTPTKTILMQVGIGDAQVPTLGAHITARSYGASLVDPPVRDVWGLETRTAPFEGSAIVEFDYGVVEPVGCEASPHETDTHEGPRREEAGQEQIRAFLEDGQVIHTCDGACDPN